MTGRRIAVGLAVVVLVSVALVLVARWTGPERDSVRAYTDLIAAANRQDVETAKSLCSSRYVATHPLTPSPDGGLVGLPRGIHKNFQVWRVGPTVSLCPTNRVGPVYRFIPEADGWRFDGPIGILRGRGDFVPLSEGRGSDSPD